jgi:hypothetical protein
VDFQAQKRIEADVKGTVTDLFEFFGDEWDNELCLYIHDHLIWLLGKDSLDPVGPSHSSHHL